MSSFIAADIDAHIRFTHRIASTIQDRLRWADLLASSLLDDHSHQPLSFTSAAFDAIRAIEAPCNLLFDLPPPALPRPRGTSSCFLYIKSTALGYPGQDLYLLRCPKCLRTTFTTLQGLLNHARIAHRLEWGTHEDCVRECAVIHPGLDTAAGVEVGVGPSGILPGIRSIFRMAVANYPEASTSLTRTLGLHEDTPTLAPFLGKNVIRRGIKVYGQDDPVDVVTLHSSLTQCHRVPLPFRNVASKDADHFNYSSKTGLVSAPNVEIRQPEILASSSQSRFYFTTRVIVTDRSLWIPPHRRQGPHSHRWMITLHSPSYAHDITTILESLTVTSADSSVYTHASVDSPPYVVIGTSDRPFLARIELLFNGIGGSEAESTISESQKIILEHWVELDSVKSVTPAVGEEQIMDIELDKRTVIGPSRPNHAAVESKAIWDQALPTASKLDGIATITEEPNFSQVLTMLTTAYPMVRGAYNSVSVLATCPTTLSESKNAVDLPYRFAQTNVHLQSMNMGRRKALEWARAKVLRDAYHEEISGRNNQSNCPILSVGDVYVWLSSKGYSYRSGTMQTPEEDSSRSGNYCHLCGFNQDTCKLISQSRSEDHPQDSHRTTKFPLVDIKDILAPGASPAINAIVPQFEFCALLSTADPKLVELVKATVEPLALLSFRDTEGGKHPATDGKLASYALLSLVMKSFIRSLILGGLNMSCQDWHEALKEAKKRRRYALTRTERMLTTSHIVRAIVAQGSEPLFRCLAHMG